MGKGVIKRALIAASAWTLVAYSISGGAELVTLEKGNQAYREGKYEEARANYLQLISAGATAPELFYNLGNIWLKDGEQGRAILNFRRSLVLDPNFTPAQRKSGLRPSFDWQRRRASFLSMAKAAFRFLVRLNCYPFLAHCNCGIVVGSQSASSYCRQDRVASFCPDFRFKSSSDSLGRRRNERSESCRGSRSKFGCSIRPGG